MYFQPLLIIIIIIIIIILLFIYLLLFFIFYFFFLQRETFCDLLFGHSAHKSPFERTNINLGAKSFFIEWTAFKKGTKQF